MTVLRSVTVVVVRPLVTEENRYGDTVIDWDQVQRRHVHRCKLAPSSSTEPRGEHRDGIVSGYTLHAPDTDIEPTDRVEYGGDTYEIDGKPEVWPSGVVAQLRKVDG